MEKYTVFDLKVGDSVIDCCYSEKEAKDWCREMYLTDVNYFDETKIKISYKKIHIN